MKLVQTSRSASPWVTSLLLLFCLAAVRISAVEYSGSGTPNNSWEVGGNWVGGAKPTAAEDAYFPSVTRIVYLDANQIAGSLSRPTGNTTVTLRGTSVDDDAYTLTLASGDITISGVSFGGNFTIYAPLTLGDTTAVWTRGSGADSSITIRAPVSEGVPGTTVEIQGTGGGVGLVKLYAALNVSGSLWIREGKVQAVAGSDILTSPGPTHNIKLGNDTGSADCLFQSGIAGETVYAAFDVVNGSAGARTIEAGHTYNGGRFAANFVLNADLTVGGYAPITISGAITGSGGLRKASGHKAGITGHAAYSGNTVVDPGAYLVFSGTTAGLGNIDVQGTLHSGITLNLAAGKELAVDGGTLCPGNPTVTGYHRVVTDKVGTLTLNGALCFGANGVLAAQLGPATTAGTTYDTLVVNGDLTLDGTLAVAPQSGFNGADGVYQIFAYTGSLSDNGMTVSGVDEPYWLDATSTPGKVYLRTGVSKPSPASGTLIIVH